VKDVELIPKDRLSSCSEAKIATPLNPHSWLSSSILARPRCDPSVSDAR